MACCPTEAKYGYDDSRFEKAVDDHFHCSICYNVLKEPMMCRNNEHLFCRDCITEHLNTNSHTCPECNEDLTVETLRRARVVSNYLSGLKIKCEYFHRGCQEYIRLEELDSHVKNCGFAPVKCSNEECEMIVNKRELNDHESTVCEYRKVKCHNCVKIEQDVEEMKDKMKEKMEVMDEKMSEIGVKIEGMDVEIKGMNVEIKGMDVKIEEVGKKMEEMETKIEKNFEGVNTKMKGMAASVDEVKGLIVQMFEKLRFLENKSPISPAVTCASTLLIEDILVAGGWDYDGRSSKSVERFSWKKNVWEKVFPMQVSRVAATSFVFENQVFVAGGCDSPVMEVLNLNEDPLQWKRSKVTLPYVCKRLRSVVDQNCAILFCACEKSDNVTEVCLTAPYTCKQLCKMPVLPREHYTVVAFERKVLIFGGSSVGSSNYLDSVLEFDLTTREFKVMPSLPSGAEHMAGVRWGDEAVLIGGFGKDGMSKKVLMYDSKTGNITELPSMLEERTGSAAVVTGNTIVVIGGRGRGGRVRSVEAFTLGGYSWRSLPAMNDIRSAPIATVLPTKNSH